MKWRVLSLQFWPIGSWIRGRRAWERPAWPWRSTAPPWTWWRRGLPFAGRRRPRGRPGGAPAPRLPSPPSRGESSGPFPADTAENGTLRRSFKKQLENNNTKRKNTKKNNKKIAKYISFKPGSKRANAWAASHSRNGWTTQAKVLSNWLQWHDLQTNHCERAQCLQWKKISKDKLWTGAKVPWDRRMEWLGLSQVEWAQKRFLHHQMLMCFEFTHFLPKSCGGFWVRRRFPSSGPGWRRNRPALRCPRGAQCAPRGSQGKCIWKRHGRERTGGVFLTYRGQNQRLFFQQILQTHQGGGELLRNKRVPRAPNRFYTVRTPPTFGTWGLNSTARWMASMALSSTAEMPRLLTISGENLRECVRKRLIFTLSHSASTTHQSSNQSIDQSNTRLRVIESTNQFMTH